MRHDRPMTVTPLTVLCEHACPAQAEAALVAAGWTVHRCQRAGRRTQAAATGCRSHRARAVDDQRDGLRRGHGGVALGGVGRLDTYQYVHGVVPAGEQAANQAVALPGPVDPAAQLPSPGAPGSAGAGGWQVAQCRSARSPSPAQRRCQAAALVLLRVATASRYRPAMPPATRPPYRSGRLPQVVQGADPVSA